MSDSASHDALLHAAMDRLAKNFPLSTGSIEDTLASVTSAAVELIDGIDHADVLLIEQDRYASMASTAPIAEELDSIQESLHEGPCLEAAVSESLIRCTDLSNEPRYPRFSAAATKLGVRSMLSYQLFSDGAAKGALNLLGSVPHTFSLEAEALGAMLATHAALAFSVVEREGQFYSALASRDHIGQAKGMLMERFGIDSVEAFDMLRRLSQETNTPIRDLAERVINSRVH
jgi:transcriptional regulator with GAF, ATPase, and Fis domain